MSKKILIMGLPGSGKTTFAEKLRNYLVKNNCTVDWFNADLIRTQHEDWDFSIEGRIRQSFRMFELAKTSDKEYTICDFIAPLPESRDNFNPDYIVWFDTIDSGRYEDTNQMFVPPVKYDFRITKDIIPFAVETVGEQILKDKQ